MSDTFNIYCDESCHLEHDRQTVMILGGLWCPSEKARQIAVQLREFKTTHGLPPTFEMKWAKVSAGQQGYYRDVLDYFFDEDDLHFRALIVPDKSKLRHDAFGQDHDQWYYKMYFTLLNPLLNPKSHYRIYVDIKDTRGAAKIAKLHDVLANSKYDFNRTIIERMQLVRSHEIEQMQLADLLIGMVGYANRNLTENAAKVALVERMRERSRYSLTKTTLLREEKTNLFRWEAASNE